MITVRKSSERGHFDHGWLDTYHTFSFARYHDPEHMGFRSLRVINEDTVAPGRGFGAHPHDNMEIITYILSGTLAHKDSTGRAQEIKPGDVQHMSAGTGIMHSEFNPSPTEPVHLMQIWIEPSEENIRPAYGQTHFPEAARRDRLRLVASPDGAEGSIAIHTDARLYATILGKGKAAGLDLKPGRHAWVQVLRGGLEVNGEKLAAGDGAGISDEKSLALTATDDAEALVFDLA
jgi:redox-sensitive bicupin YhaK (pirin superfamily)